ncbi:MAG: hypothetical protein SWO11_13835 [Thermodesulfobacteriota bacterium]|nr:hypothetical protein [Thermodesulfobacteriota bacterium]
MKRGYKVAILHRGTHEIDLPSDIEHLHGDPHFIETLNETLGARTFGIVIVMYGRLRYIAEVMRERTERLICAGGAAVYRRWLHPRQNPNPADSSFLIPENAPLVTSPEPDGLERDAFFRFSNLLANTELNVMEHHHLGYYKASICSFPMIYGPRQLIPGEWSIIRRILDGRKRLIVADGGLIIESRGYSENMAHGLFLCVDHPEESAGQVYNVADEDALSLKDWIETISEVMDYEFEWIFPQNLQHHLYLTEWQSALLQRSPGNFTTEYWI